MPLRRSKTTRYTDTRLGVPKGRSKLMLRRGIAEGNLEVDVDTEDLMICSCLFSMSLGPVTALDLYRHYYYKRSLAENVKMVSSTTKYRSFPRQDFFC